ncbi:hypothetical protein [Paenibacillus lautus]|nr:hypothetical protein [Paenibacillus lautus]
MERIERVRGQADKGESPFPLFLKPPGEVRKSWLSSGEESKP